MPRIAREVREARAIMVAEHQLKRRLDTIAFEEEVLYPTLERVADGTLDVSYTPSTGVVQRELEAGE